MNKNLVVKLKIIIDTNSLLYFGNICNVNLGIKNTQILFFPKFQK